MHNQVKVLLPCWIFDKAEDDKQELRRLILRYMKRYPDYTVLKVQGQLAICSINR